MLLSAGLLLTGLNPLAGDGSGALNRIRTANQLAAAAEAAYAHQRDAAAIDAYEHLAELTPLPEEARLTLAHAHFRLGHRAQARAGYAALSASATAGRRAVALHQLGLLAAAERDYDRALPLLRAALRLAPTAPAIRASYETLARWLAAGPTDDNPPPGGSGSAPRPQPRPDGRPAAAETRLGGPGAAPAGTGDQPGGGDRPTATGERNQPFAQGRQPGDTRGFGPEPGGPNGGPPSRRPRASAAAANERAGRVETLRVPQPDATISAAQARMLLEAMQAAENQYLQQLPRPPRPAADPTRPDW
ncbi:MAG: hypothetical protein H7330_11745 [Hymenobacteraceae bacterium]|nr:hypothetical protein [Hymenobacteraceae bacterium]